MKFFLILTLCLLANLSICRKTKAKKQGPLDYYLYPKFFSGPIGILQDIATGADNSLYAIAGPELVDGYTVFKYTTSGWICYPTVDGGATAVAGDAKGQPWIVNRRNQLKYFDSNTRTWVHVGNNAQDVAIGADNIVYITSAEWKGNSGFAIYKYENNYWSSFNGAGVKVAGGNNGRHWLISADLKYYEYQEATGYTHSRSSVQDIAGYSNTRAAYVSDGSVYSYVNGAHKKVDTGNAGVQFVAINSKNLFYATKEGYLFSVTV